MYRVSMILQNKLRFFCFKGGEETENNLFQTEEQKNKFEVCQN